MTDAAATPAVAEQKWEQGFQSLLAFVAEHGHARVPQEHRQPDGHWLGKWVHNTRQAFRQARLSLDRIDRLERVPGWSWHARTPATKTALVAYHSVWNTSYEQVRQFHLEHGRLPFSKEEPGLYDWIIDQRILRARGRLHQVRIDLLDEIPGWTWKTQAEKVKTSRTTGFDQNLWAKALAALRAYTAEHGTSYVPQKYVTLDGFRLGDWVHLQRLAYNKGAITPFEIERLEAFPGWVWNAHAESWEKHFRLLEAFAIKHGHCDLPPNYGATLGLHMDRWIYRQRTHHLGLRRNTKQRLRPQRAARLEALPGWTWEEPAKPTLFDIVAWLHDNDVDCNGTMPHHPGGVNLGAWRTRIRRKKQDLTVQEREAVESLRGWSWLTQSEQNEQIWHATYEEVRQFLLEHGEPPAVGQHPSARGTDLGAWYNLAVRRCRSHATAERRELLRALPGFEFSCARHGSATQAAA